jgi:O-antigen ligase
LCLSGITAIAVLGWPHGRNIGSIQPNLFAAPLLVGFILSQFHPGLLGVVVRILCFAMVALVSSRFAIIGCILALTLCELTFNPLRPATIAASLVAAIAAAMLWPQIMTILAFDDSTRDFSSGFAGRNQYWYSALAAIAEHPLGIGFKRAIGDEAGHNGYLKTLLEFGVAGGGLIIAFVAFNIVSAGLDAIRSSQRRHRERRFASARLGGLAALSFGAFFQPQLLSLGDAFAMSFLLLLFRPALPAASATVPRADRCRPAMLVRGKLPSRRLGGS